MGNPYLLAIQERCALARVCLKLFSIFTWVHKTNFKNTENICRIYRETKGGGWLSLWSDQIVWVPEDPATAKCNWNERNYVKVKLTLALVQEKSLHDSSF